MVDFAAMIEERSTKWMQAWIKKDLAVLEGMLAPDFALIVSATPNQQFDRASWLSTATSRYTCSEFSYREVQVRKFGDHVAVMSSIAEFTADIDGVPRNGPMFVTDVWREAEDGFWRVCGRYTAYPEPREASSEALEQLKR